MATSGSITVIRIPPDVLIEAHGATRLHEVGNWYVLHGIDDPFMSTPRPGVPGIPAPLLKFQGATVFEGQFGAWKPIAAERTADGYLIAWKNGTADQYSVWNTDSDGNFTSAASDIVPGSNMALQIQELVFQQDLNGNGQIGLPTTTIENFGSTHLDEVGGQFFMRDSGGAGPSVKFGGTAFTEGRFGAWTVIGAEQTVGGYLAAVKFGAADQYQVWNLDGAGNFVGAPLGTVAASSIDLQILENSFQQDLNGDGQLGPATTTIESFGATHLDAVGNQFFLRDSGGAGPSLKFGGTALTEGRFGAWTAIGAEQTAGGYQAAMKFGAADQYQVWNLDSNGNFLGTATPVATVSGSDIDLQMLESGFQQDLNGDGRIGPVTTTIESFGSTRLVEVGNQYFMQDGGGAGPSVKFGGTPFTEGRFGAWTLIGAEQTVGGYVAAIKFGAADQYQVWNLDGSGNFVSAPLGTVTGSDPALRALEPTFHQDLNGDSQIGSLTAESGVEHLAVAIATFNPLPAGQATPPQETSNTLTVMLATNQNQY